MQKKSTIVCVLCLLAGIVIGTPLPGVAQTQNLSLTWSRNPETNIAGYRVYVGMSSGAYVTSDWVPSPTTTMAYSATPGTRYYFAVSAVNTQGVEGPLSSEVAGGVPTFAQLVDQVGSVGVPVTPVDMIVTDPDGGLIAYSAEGLPAGLTIGTSTGRITGTPTSAGTSTVTVWALGGHVTLSRSFVWTISALPVSADSVTPSSGTGALGTFTARFSDMLGVADLGVVHVKFSAVVGGAAGTCQVRYDRAAGLLALRDDAGAWLPGQAPGTAAIQQNSQCAVNVANSLVVASGQTLTVALAMAFTPAYWGTKNVYLYATSGGNLVTDWQTRGSWTVPVATIPLSAGWVTPDSGTGVLGRFTAQFSDTWGTADLGVVHVKFSTVAGGAAGTCQVRYDRASRLLALRDDAGVWLAGQAPGSNAIQQNTQCAVNVANSRVVESGETLSLTVAMAFAQPYAGTRNVYLYAASVGGVVTDWQLRGVWTVPVVTVPVSAGWVTPDSGTGASGRFTAQFLDTWGTADLGVVHVKFGAAASGAVGTCQVRYDRASGLLALRDDAGVWLPGQVPGSNGVQQNSQCAVDVANSRAVASGQTLSLTVAMTFTPAYAGTKNVYLYATGLMGDATDWQPRGSWTVP